jgi:membrane protease YdiL (CAAX protease family)
MHTLKKQMMKAQFKTWGIVLCYLIGWFIAMGILSLPLLWLPEMGELNGHLFNDVIMLVAAFLVTFLFCKFIHGETLSGIGLGAFAARWKDLLWGLLYGMAAIVAGFLICVATGLVEITGVHIPADIFYVFVTMIVVAVTEELLFRGYVLRRFMTVYNKYVALAVSSALFMLMHGFNDHLNVLPLVNLFLAGVLLGIYYLYTQNLWFSIGLHFTWNFFQGSVCGFAVSGTDTGSIIFQQPVADMDWLTGGAFGFEGSALCSVICILMTLAIYFQYRNKATATAGCCTPRRRCSAP